MKKSHILDAHVTMHILQCIFYKAHFTMYILQCTFTGFTLPHHPFPLTHLTFSARSLTNEKLKWCPGNRLLVISIILIHLI